MSLKCPFREKTVERKVGENKIITTEFETCYEGQCPYWKNVTKEFNISTGMLSTVCECVRVKE